MAETCTAALNIKGEHFPCDQTPIPHNGWPHANTEAQAVWCGDDGPHANPSGETEDAQRPPTARED